MSNPIIRGTVNASVSVSSSGSAIQDGVDSAIKATVKDYPNSNPLTVVIVDSNGDAVGGSAVSIADGSDVNAGDRQDLAVTGDNEGTESAKLRGINKILSDSWDSGNHWQKVSLQNTSIAVSQSGTWDEIGINDSGNSITVDYATTGSGTATGALRVELPTNGTGVIASVGAISSVVQVGDNSGSLTVDYATTGSGTATGALRVELPTNGTGVIATVGAVTAITNALPAGTNAIGKLAANSGVDIGDIDVTTVIPGTGATQLGKAIDAVGGATDTGVAILSIRDDALTTLSPVDGDYVATRTNARGAVWMAIEDGAGAQITSFGGGTQYTEDAAAPSDPVGPTMMFTRDDQLSTVTEIEGDWSRARGTSKGALWVALADSAGDPITSFGGGTQYTEDAVSAADPTGNALMVTRDDQLSTVTEVEGDWSRLRGTSKGALWVALADSSGDPITSFGGGTQYVEDAAAAADPTGTVPMLVRKDTPATTVTTDGDNIAQRGTNYGAAYVQVVSSSGSFIDSFGGSGGTAMVDDGAFTVGTTTFTPSGGTYKSTRDAVDDNDGGAFAMNAKRAMYVSLETPNSDSVLDDTLDAVKVVNATAANLNVTAAAGTNLNTSLLALEAGGNLATIAALSKTEDAGFSSGNTGVMALAIRQSTVTDQSIGATNGDYEPLQVDANGRLWVSALIDTALPAGTAAIGKLAANSGVDIGDVDVTTVGTITPGTATTSLGKAEDVAHGTGDVGVMSLAVRKNTAASTSDADGDYQPLITNTTGHLWVDASGQTLTVGSHAVTNAGTFATQPASATAPVVTMNSASANAGVNCAVAGVFDDVAPTSITENSFGFLRMSANRNQYSTLRDAAGNERGANVNASNQLSVSVDNTVTVGSHAVTNAGTFVVQENGSALTSLQLIDDVIIADDAAFTPATTKVAMAGFEADESSTDSVDEGDAGAARMTLDRKQIVTVQPHTAGGLSVFNATSSDGATALTSTAQAIKASAGQIYGWYIYNPNSSAQFVQLYNTASGSVTVGTTNPLFMLTIPATAAANILGTSGIEFTNAGFSCSATSTAGGSGAPSIALDAVFFYK